MPRDLRILSLDGGGTWAIIQAVTLGHLYGYDTPGRQIVGRFGVATANSGGSLVLAGLLLDWTPRRIASMFADDRMRRSLFRRNAGPLRLLDRVLGIGLHRYSESGKRHGLEIAFGTDGGKTLRALSDAVAGDTGSPPPRLLVVGYDYDRRRAHFFRSHADTGAAADDRLLDAVHASTNAPVIYFDAPAVVASVGGGSRRYWDGGLTGMNNPSLAALVDAVTAMPGEDVLARAAILSLGTGTTQLPIIDRGASRGLNADQRRLVQVRESPTLPRDIGKAAGSVLDDPPDAASYVAMAMMRVGEGEQSGTDSSPLVRMNPLIQPMPGGRDPGFEWRLPGRPGASGTAAPEAMGSVEFGRLAELEMDAIEWRGVDLIRRLTRFWMKDMVLNQPVRSDAQFRPVHGHATFSQARAAWERFDTLAAVDDAETETIFRELHATIDRR